MLVNFSSKNIKKSERIEGVSLDALWGCLSNSRSPGRGWEILPDVRDTGPRGLFGAFVATTFSVFWTKKGYATHEAVGSHEQFSVLALSVCFAVPGTADESGREQKREQGTPGNTLAYI